MHVFPFIYSQFYIIYFFTSVFIITHSCFLLYVFIIFSQPPYGYRSLTDTTLTDHVTYIGMYAFYKRSSPRSLTLQEYTAAIGDYAFAYCTGLTRSIYVTVQSQPVRTTNGSVVILGTSVSAILTQNGFFICTA